MESFSEDFKKGAEQARADLKARLADIMFPGFIKHGWDDSPEMTDEEQQKFFDRRRQLWQNAKDVQDILDSTACKFGWEL